MRYTLGRLAQLVPVLLGISIIVFLLVRLIPGDPAMALLGSRATPQLVARVREQLGLDLPLWRQYLGYLLRALRGDFGTSYFYQASVWTITMARVPTTLLLMAYSLLLAMLLAVPFGLWAAVRRGHLADAVIRVAFTTALGVPPFWLGIMLALLLGVTLHLFPITGVGSGGLDTLHHLTLPALTIALALAPMLVRTLRSSLVEVLAADYVTTGRALGLNRRYFVPAYLLRNGLRPVVTMVSLNIGYLIGGTVVAEQIFSLPGIGSLLLNSITTRDYAVIQLATLLFALLVVVVNLLADVAYRVLDPRVDL